MSIATSELSPSQPGEPAWEIAELFPVQGCWSEEEYLSLTTNRLVEFDNGKIEVLPVPTRMHQVIALFLYRMLEAFVAGGKLSGLALAAPYRVRVPSGKYREPDVLYMTPEQNAAATEEYTDAAEFVIEVVSPDDPARDYVVKRREYAAASVPEYWIVDRAKRAILVLRLQDGEYIEHAQVTAGRATAAGRLEGFSVDIDEMFSLDKNA